MEETKKTGKNREQELSYTKISTLMDCEYKYYLRYVERVSTPTGSALVFGSALHNAIKAAYESGLDREGWIKVFVNEWKTLTSIEDVHFLYENEYMARIKEGKKIIGDYYDKFVADSTFSPKHLEFRFTKSDGIKVGDFFLVGAIDQIDSANNIIDLKSGTKPVAFTLDYDLQLTIYSYVYRKLFGEEEGGLIIRHLGTSADMPAGKRTQKDFDILEEEIDKFGSKVKSGIFLRNIGRSCAYCQYAKKCLGIEKKSFNRFSR
jgi:ATP-dependent helicase/DNAse subunit B